MLNPANDTIHYHQNFYDYYAYDDGSAESGYNVNGAGAMIAMKYTILKADTLRALQIFFEQIGAPATGQPFKIVVWNVAGEARERSYTSRAFFLLRSTPISSTGFSIIS